MNLAIKTDIVIIHWEILITLKFLSSQYAGDSTKCNGGVTLLLHVLHAGVLHVLLHAVALVGRHPSVGVVEGPGRRGGCGSTVSQHELRLGLCNKETVRQELLLQSSPSRGRG